MIITVEAKDLMASFHCTSIRLATYQLTVPYKKCYCHSRTTLPEGRMSDLCCSSLIRMRSLISGLPDSPTQYVGGAVALKWCRA